MLMCLIFRNFLQSRILQTLILMNSFVLKGKPPLTPSDHHTMLYINLLTTFFTVMVAFHSKQLFTDVVAIDREVNSMLQLTLFNLLISELPTH